MRLEKWPVVNRPLQIDKANNGRSQRKVRSFWSNGFSGSIFIPDRTLRPGRKLQGKVVIHSKALVTFSGLRVQLDAQCTLFLEKNGELITKRFSILQTDLPNNAQSNINASNTGRRNNNSNGSIIQCDAIESLSNSKEMYALVPDINTVVDATTFPFSLDIPGDRAFPAPFNNTMGTLVYKLSAHLCSQDLRYVQISEEVLDFKGYFNLSQNLAETGRPIYIHRPLPSLPTTPTSSFSSSSSSKEDAGNSVGVSFHVESSGFLPEEAIHFVLNIKNPKRMAMQMRVFMAQKITYSIAENCWKRVTSTVVKCERAEVNIGHEGEVVWKGALIIPKGLAPSCGSGGSTSQPGYSVSYSLQFKVEGLDHAWLLKGITPIHIGTCRNGHDGRLIITG